MVDDESAVRSLTRRALEGEGFNILTAPDGETAIRMICHEKKAVDLVLLHVTMPDLNGQDIFDRLKACDSTLKVVVSSGHGEEEVLGRFDHRELDGCLQKPYRIADLVAAVSAALGA